MVLLISLLACRGDVSSEQVYLSGGNWQVTKSASSGVDVTGVVMYFTGEQRTYFYCLYDCSGRIDVAHPSFLVEASASNVLAEGFDSLLIRSTESSVFVKASQDTEVHSVRGDVWIEAVAGGQVNVLNSDGDVDVVLPSSDWETRLSGDHVISQVTPSSEIKSGILEVYTVGGTIRVVEVLSHPQALLQ